MSNKSYNKKLLIALFIIACLFIISTSKVEAAHEGFKVKYYRDEALEEEIEGHSKLKEGDYYIKITNEGESVSSVKISIDSEGYINDVDNAESSKIDANNFKYKRSIKYDSEAQGINLEKILINDKEPLDGQLNSCYIDTNDPKLDIQSYNNGGVDIYKLASNEPLSYLKVELRSDLYAILYKGYYTGTFKTYYGWHVKIKKGSMSLVSIDVFKDTNEYVLKYVDTTVKIIMAENESEFAIEIDGPEAETIRNQDSIPLLVKDVAQNEVSGQFEIPQIFNKEEATFSLRQHIIDGTGVKKEYELLDKNGKTIDLTKAIEIKRRIKDSSDFETINDLNIRVEDKGEYIYTVLFDDIEYTAEISLLGVETVAANKTGNVKEVDGKIYYEYAIPNISFSHSPLYEIASGEGKTISVKTSTIFFDQEKEGDFTYYLQKGDNWYKFSIHFEKDLVPAPSLKSFSFNQKEENKIFYAFEISSTGHKDIYVNEAVLTIYDKDSNIAIEDKKEGQFTKDTPYTFELNSAVLNKGETYSYTITLSNTSKTYESTKTEFTVRPGNVSNINISKLDLNKIKLSFEKGIGSTGTIILDNNENIIYKGEDNSFEYELTKEDTFLCLVSYKLINEAEFKGFSEVEIEVGSYYTEVPAITLPQVKTLEAINITETEALIKGELLNNGGSDNVSLSFEYGKESGNYTEIKELTSNIFELALTNLDPETTYYFRAKACNEAGCNFGEEKSFKTAMHILESLLKTSSFEEGKDTSTISFEIEDTGHKDIYVNEIILNIYNEENNLVYNNKKVGEFKKDTSYTFELDKSVFLKGKTYSYSIILKNTSKTHESDKKEFTVRPGDVSNISIAKIDSNKIKLSFEKGEGSLGTIVLNREGNVVYKGSEELFEYNLSKEDTYLYFISYTEINEAEFKGFSEVEIEVGSYYTEVPAITLPQVKTLEAINITETEALIKGELLNNGGSDNVSLSFEYGKESGNCTEIKELESSNFELALTNLDPETTYYFRAKACNEAGCSYGKESNFKTNMMINAPILKNASFEEKQDKSLFTFEIENTGNKSIYVEKASLKIFNQNNEIVLTEIKEGNFEKDIPYIFELDIRSLKKGEMYFYSLILENSSKASEEEKVSFITKPGDVSNITIDEKGVNEISLSFQKGEGSLGTIVLNSERNIVFKGEENHFDYNLSSSDTFLYFIAYKIVNETEIRSFNEVEVGVSEYFKEVPQIELPQVNTKEAIDITETEAIIKGELLNNGGSNNVSLSFEYGKESGNYTEIKELTSNIFELALTNLDTETTYYFRAKACNEAGCNFGEEKSFKTAMHILESLLKTSSFEEGKDTSTISFEIEDTGHKDIYVEKVTLNIFDENNFNIFEDVKYGEFKKDVSYTFNIDSSMFSKGEKYFYSLTLENSSKIHKSEEVEFIIRPGDVSNIAVAEAGVNKIRLVFEKGEGSDKTIVLNNNDDIVYNGNEESFEYSLSSTDTSLYFNSYLGELKGFNEKEVEVGSYYTEIPNIVLPQVKTLEAINITETEAIIKGELLNNGGSNNVSLSFEYGKESGNYTEIKELTSNIFELALTNLDTETTYYFRAKACNEAGCSYGNESNFTTKTVVGEPILKNSSINESEQGTIVNFEISSTGHKDIYVNEAVLTIYNKDNTIALQDKKEGQFTKDTPYTFGLDSKLLSKGETYSYTITLSNTSKTYESTKTEFTVRPGDVSNINISKVNTNKIKLSFEKGIGSTGTIILDNNENIIYKGQDNCFEYELTKEDTFLYLVSYKLINEAELKGFNEIEVDTSSYYEEAKPEKGVFNNNTADFPLRLGNHTKSAGTQEWVRDLMDITLGDELRFSVYYHNASTKIAKNAKITITLSYGLENKVTVISKLTADDFEDYISEATIEVNSEQDINFENSVKWYHNYDGSKYDVDDLNVNILGDSLTFDLGDIEPGYRPNDGYLIFNARVDAFPQIQIQERGRLYDEIISEVEEIKTRELIVNNDNIITMEYGEESENYTEQISFNEAELKEEALNSIELKEGTYYKINLNTLFYGKEHLL
ncbi:MAG: fibronectin type III domain-containing protein [Candidatus Pacebacteria bacterium]|nr:fibronectin type III domain-containing protein [Candidatus Paceibacterota bacterium]